MCAMHAAKVLEELLFVNLLQGNGGDLSPLEHSLCPFFGPGVVRPTTPNLIDPSKTKKPT